MIPQQNLAVFSIFCFSISLLFNNQLPAQLDQYQRLTTFTKERVWESAQGTKLTGKLVSLGLDDEIEIVASSKPEPIKLRLKQLSKQDQQFIARLREEALKDTVADARQLGTAPEVRDLYQKLISDGLAPPENKKNLQALLEILNRHAEANSISIPGEFLKPRELEERKKEARQLIENWISESNEDFRNLKNGDTLETKKIKEAIRKDPTSVEAVLLLSLLYGLKEGNLEAEERRLTDATETAKRYSKMSDENEGYNMAGAFNNLAVNCCRQNQVNKALRHWTNAAELADGEIKEIIGENLVRLTELAQNTSEVTKANTGLAATKQELNRAEELFEIFNPVSTKGGWKLVVPKDKDGQVRENIPFVLAPKTTFLAQVIGDTRCMRCSGLGLDGCPNKPCKRGKVSTKLYKDRYITMSDGSRRHVGKAPAGVRWDPCPVCRGHEKGLVKCPTCSGSGAQK